MKEFQTEAELLSEMLRREKNRCDGTKTYSAEDMQLETEELLDEDIVSRQNIQ